MTQRLIFEAADEAGTERLGKALAAALPDGAVVALIGELGAGKTRLVQAIASAIGVDPSDVISPTFVLVRQYTAAREMVHADLYRIADADEMAELGTVEMLSGPQLSFIEWADRFIDFMPDERLEIRIEVTGPTSRRFEIRSRVEALDPMMARLQELLSL